MKLISLMTNMTSNGWGAQAIVEIENSVELLCIFQMFYYFNGRLHLPTDFCRRQMAKHQRDLKKISMRTLYELFKDTKSHGLVSLQFLSVLKLFWV